MKSANLWTLFKNTGSIDSYLRYKDFENFNCTKKGDSTIEQQNSGIDFESDQSKRQR